MGSRLLWRMSAPRATADPKSWIEDSETESMPDVPQVE